MKGHLVHLLDIFIQFGLWPAVAVIAMRNFRTEIVHAFGRVNKLGPVGLDPIQSQSKEPLESEKVRLAAEEATKGIADNLIIQEIEENINADLKARSLDGRVEAIPALVKNLAAAILAAEFESIYNSIFGSQLAMLNHLNSRIPNGDTAESLKQFYSNAAAAYPALYATKSFEEYLSFLVSRLLIKESDGKYHLTNKGKEFLVQIVRTGYTLNKFY